MLLHGDCLTHLRSLPNGSVDLVVTDPPYEVATSGAGIYKQADKQYVKELVGIDKGFDEEVLLELVRVMKKVNIYLFCSKKQIPKLLKFFVDGIGCNFDLLTWHKTNPVPACGNKYLSDTEFILFFRERGVRIGGSFSTKFTYYVTPLNQSDKKLFNHPTIKPLHIVRNLITNSSEAGDTVLDPFMGSGTTCVAAKELGREFIGIDREAEYVAIAQARLDGVVASGPQLFAA